MFRVYLAILFSVLFVAPALVGCGGGQVADEEAASEATDNAPVESPANDADNP